MEELVDQGGDRQEAVRHVGEHSQVVERRQLLQSLPDVWREVASSGNGTATLLLRGSSGRAM
ncbi:MAG: hypothetical protein WB500_09015 [Rhodoplanes sp.]